MDIHTAQTLGCVLTPIPAHGVTITGGGTLLCTAMCSNFTWIIQGVQFQADMHVITLGGCDAVLGVQWLQQVGPVTIDFSKLQMQICYQHQSIILQGLQSLARLSFMSSEALYNYSLRYPTCTRVILFIL